MLRMLSNASYWWYRFKFTMLCYHLSQVKYLLSGISSRRVSLFVVRIIIYITLMIKPYQCAMFY